MYCVVYVSMYVSMMVIALQGYHYDPEEVELKKEKDSGKNTTVHVSDVKEKDSSSTLLQAVEGSSAEMDQSTVKFEGIHVCTYV